MIPIQLTFLQKSKILEMCEYFFPEDAFEFGDKALGDTRFEDFLCSYKKPYYRFHWFEICMTHLLDKLFDHNVLEGYNCQGNFVMMHLVDYLYQAFEIQKKII